MKKTTSQKLSNRLAKYSALSLAIAGVADANGEIIPTVVNQTFGIGDEYFLDLDGDTVDDFRIYHDGSETLNMEPYNPNNEALGSFGSASASNYYGYPYALSLGAPIADSPPSGSWMNNNYSVGYMWLNYGSQASSCSAGNWCNVSNKYLGLRFDISGVRHYGWAKLSVNPIGDVWTVIEYAYEDNPGTGLNAGEGSLTLKSNDNVFTKSKIVALNKSIALYNLPQQTNYRLFSITGQSVLNGKVSNNTYVIEANTLASGIYIIELQDTKTNAVIRKKIVL